MGTIKLNDSIASALFGKTKQAVLSILYGHPGTRYYMRQIVDQVGAGTGAVQRELQVLAESGLINRSHEGKQVYFEANQKCPVYEEIKKLVSKTSGIADVVRSALKPVSGQISFALIFGSVARGTYSKGSDIDLLVIGRISFMKVVDALARAQVKLDREINPVVFSKAEFKEKLTNNDHFVRTLKRSPKIMVAGEADEFEKLAK